MHRYTPPQGVSAEDLELRLALLCTLQQCSMRDAGSALACAEAGLVDALLDHLDVEFAIQEP